MIKVTSVPNLHRLLTQRRSWKKQSISNIGCHGSPSPNLKVQQLWPGLGLGQQTTSLNRIPSSSHWLISSSSWRREENRPHFHLFARSASVSLATSQNGHRGPRKLLCDCFETGEHLSHKAENRPLGAMVNHPQLLRSNRKLTERSAI